MQSYFRFVGWTAPLLVVAFLVGCKTEPAGDTPAQVAKTPGAAEDHEHEHAHDHEGPHGGHIIELGRNHEYHAELVEDHDAKAVTIYILDEEMKSLPIAAESLTLNLVAGDQPQIFELAPSDAADGKAAIFASPDAALFEALEANPEATVRVQVTIDGTPYSGELSHEHHDHDHEEHKQ